MKIFKIISSELMKREIKLSENNFSETALSEAHSLEISADRFNRSETVTGITIDGPNSKDLDDAILLHKKKNGFLLQISIADVASVVAPTSHIFREALNRVRTIYTNRGNIPMLPHLLSENKLSLLEGEERQAMTFNLVISPEGEIRNIEIHETIFRSRRRLSYAQFDKILKREKDDPDYDLIVDCSNLAQFLLDTRRQKGALAIYDLKRRIYTTEEGIVLPLGEERAHLANIVVQEFMILVNKAVAHFFAEQERELLFRNHLVSHNAPGREEVITQFNQALLDPKFLGALSRRSNLWFNKATYDPVLKGHFGLNEAAYTHVTSPLRRVPDLINQLQIKAFLHKEDAPFPHENLAILSENINKKMRQKRKERVDFFKEKAKKKIYYQLAGTSIEELVEMNSNEFKRILKEAIPGKVHSEILLQSLTRRFELKSIDVNHLYLILFETDEADEHWGRFKKMALNFASENPGYSNQLLNMAVQNGKLNDIEVETQTYQAVFLARIISTRDGGEISIRWYATGSNKKEALHRASLKFLEGLLEDSLVSGAETMIPAQLISSGPPADSIPTNENFVGQLYEICSRQKDWSLPSYRFQVSGPSHQPLVKCECSLETPEQVLESSGIGSNKKTAKQIAARGILELLPEKMAKQPLQYQIPEIGEEFEPDKNYVGMLLEICQKNHWELPDYLYSQEGVSPQQTFHCTLFLKPGQEVQEFYGDGVSKKSARQNAAFNGLKYLLKSSQSSLGSSEK